VLLSQHSSYIQTIRKASILKVVAVYQLTNLAFFLWYVHAPCNVCKQDTCISLDPSEILKDQVTLKTGVLAAENSYTGK